MATAILNKKKAVKAAPTKNETLLRTRTIQRAAILLKQVSDPTRLQVIALLSEEEAKRAIAAYFKNRFMAVALLSTPAFNTRLPSTGTLP